MVTGDWCRLRFIKGRYYSVQCDWIQWTNILKKSESEGTIGKVKSMRLKGKNTPHTSKRTGLRLERGQSIQLVGGKFRCRWTHVVSMCGSILVLLLFFSVKYEASLGEWTDQQNVGRSAFRDQECAIRQHGGGFFWTHFSRSGHAWSKYKEIAFYRWNITTRFAGSHLFIQ